MLRQGYVLSVGLGRLFFMVSTDPLGLTMLEARACVLIDTHLTAAGWVVKDRKDMNLCASHGVTVRENCDYGNVLSFQEMRG